MSMTLAWKSCFSPC